jgi:hypothetical protein
MVGLPARHRPEELGSLERSTKFTRKEIKKMYQSFKQVFKNPSTLLNSDILFDVKKKETTFFNIQLSATASSKRKTTDERLTRKALCYYFEQC